MTQPFCCFSMDGGPSSGGPSPGPSSGASSGSAGESAPSTQSLREQLNRLREERDALQDKLNAVAEVIGAEDPAKVVHDVRNVMNELLLLRKMVELED